MAETVRRVADYAEALGLVRPSYSHLRRHVRAERERAEADRARRAAIRKIVADVYVDLTVGRVVDAYEVAERVRRANAEHG